MQKIDNATEQKFKTFIFKCSNIIIKILSGIKIQNN